MRVPTFRLAAYLFLVTASCLAGGQARPPLEPARTVEAIAFGERLIRIFWAPVRGAERYRIDRDGTAIGFASAEQTTFEDRSVQPGTTHRYQVIPLGEGGAPGPAGRGYVERSYADLPASSPCDLLVVGANSAGISAAVASARYGRKVVLIEERRRMGGMAANGLGASDIRKAEHSSGFFEEFRRRVRDIYGQGNGLRYEPRVAQQALKEILWSLPNLTVYRQVRATGVRMEGVRIAEVRATELRSGRKVSFIPRLVVDATECGDIGAWAGAPYRMGREPRSAREPHAGHIYYDRAGDRILPGSTGRGDRRLQAYAYLMVVQDYGPGADRTIPKPHGYDPAKYDHAPPWNRSWAVTSGALPNRKFEINQHPEGSDLQEANYTYPDAGPEERARIEKLYREHALGYLYYIQTVEGHRNLGLPEDEYRDSDGWPALLYIREARRFEGSRVLDETDIMNARSLAHPNSIGVADYAMDSHATQVKRDFTTPDMGEGEFYLPQHTPWHQVPFDIMVPSRVTNLFAPTAVSATHVAYGSYRMEPVRMQLGAAAGVAAHLCLKYGYEPSSVPVRQVQEEMLKRDLPAPGRFAMDGPGAPGPLGAPALPYLFSDIAHDTPKYRSILWLGARGFYPCPAPAERTPASQLRSAPFHPDEPIPRGEALFLCRALGERYGSPPPKEALEALEGDPKSRLDRASAARVFSVWIGAAAVSGENPYADLNGNEADAARRLFGIGIDSRLWDAFTGRGAGGKLLFRPKEAITRSQFAELLYLAAQTLGPLFEDHPADRRDVLLTNGRIEATMHGARPSADARKENPFDED